MLFCCCCGSKPESSTTIFRPRNTEMPHPPAEFHLFRCHRATPDDLAARWFDSHEIRLGLDAECGFGCRDAPDSVECSHVHHSALEIRNEERRLHRLAVGREDNLTVSEDAGVFRMAWDRAHLLPRVQVDDIRLLCRGICWDQECLIPQSRRTTLSSR